MLAINTLLKLVPPIVFASLVGFLLMTTLVQTWRHDSALTALGAAKAAVTQCKGVNEKNVIVVNDLRGKAIACVADRLADEAEFDLARTDWLIERGELRLQATEQRINEIQVYEDPDCADLAQLDITAVCPDLAIKLRERAGSRHGVRNSRGANPG